MKWLPWWLRGVRNLPAVWETCPGLGKSPGEGTVNPLQYSCLENPMDRGALWASVNGVAKTQTRMNK